MIHHHHHHHQNFYYRYHHHHYYYYYYYYCLPLLPPSPLLSQPLPYLLLLTALLGIIPFLVVLLTHDGGDNPIVGCYGLFMALWGVVMLEYWKRKQKTIALEWGMNGKLVYHFGNFYCYCYL